MYIAIDGDDSGRKIVACYINNDEVKLRQISDTLARAVKNISELLETEEFRIVFCAADGIVAVSQSEKDYSKIFDEIKSQAPDGFTFSAGVGNTLREAYVALLDAKCSGKNRLSLFRDIEHPAS